MHRKEKKKKNRNAGKTTLWRKLSTGELESYEYGRKKQVFRRLIHFLDERSSLVDFFFLETDIIHYNESHMVSVIWEGNGYNERIKWDRVQESTWKSPKLSPNDIGI